MRTHLKEAPKTDRTLLILPLVTLLLGIALAMLFSLAMASGHASAQVLQLQSGRLQSAPQSPLAASPPYSTTTDISSITSVHPNGDKMVGFAMLVTVVVKPGSNGVSEVPGGIVNVTTGGGPTCSITLSGGSGTCGLFFTTTGDYNVTADYPGVSGTWLSSSDSSTINGVLALSLSRSLSAGRYHTCSLSETGSFSCWGLSQTFPNTGGVPNTISNVKEVSAGGYSTCALNTDGTADCWGDNGYITTSVPSAPFLSISTGKDHVCAIDTSYHLNCWGDPQALPLTTTVGLSKPITEVVAVSAGDNYDCAIRKLDDKLECWGWSGISEAGMPTAAVRAVSVGDRHACAILKNNPNKDEVRCWGNLSISFGGTDMSEIELGLRLHLRPQTKRR